MLRIFTSFTNISLRLNMMVSLRVVLSSFVKKKNKEMKNNLNSCILYVCVYMCIYRYTYIYTYLYITIIKIKLSK